VLVWKGLKNNRKNGWIKAKLNSLVSKDTLDVNTKKPEKSKIGLSS
jgi:hypothetical protein